MHECQTGLVPQVAVVLLQHTDDLDHWYQCIRQRDGRAAPRPLLFNLVLSSMATLCFFWQKNNHPRRLWPGVQSRSFPTNLRVLLHGSSDCTRSSEVSPHAYPMAGSAKAERTDIFLISVHPHVPARSEWPALHSAQQ
jgi:hypothetical protein